MLQVGKLDQALILLGLALSFKHFCIFGLHDVVYIYNFLFYSLPFNELSLV